MTQKEYGSKFIKALGGFVGEWKTKGKKGGLSKEEIKQVIKLTFDILGRKR